MSYKYPMILKKSLFLSMASFASIAWADVKSVNIGNSPKPVVECRPQGVVLMKLCRRFDADLVRDFPLPQIYGVSYRDSINTKVELDLDFRFANNDYSLEIDGVKQPIPSEVEKVSFQIPKSDKQSITIRVVRNRLVDKYVNVDEHYTATIKAVRLILDNISFKTQIQDRLASIKIIDKAIEASEQVHEWSSAFEVMYEVASLFYSKLTAEELQNISNQKDNISRMLLSFMQSENICLWDNASDTEKTCLTSEEKILLHKINAAISVINIPTLWQKPDGSLKTFSEYIEMFIPSEPKAKEVAARIFTLIGKQSIKEIGQKYEVQITALNGQKQKILLEIEELKKY